MPCYIALHELSLYKSEELIGSSTSCCEEALLYTGNLAISELFLRLEFSSLISFF